MVGRHVGLQLWYPGTRYKYKLLYVQMGYGDVRCIRTLLEINIIPSFW